VFLAEPPTLVGCGRGQPEAQSPMVFSKNELV
jgi:hypothetical protein